MAIEYARPDADAAAGGWTTSTGSATNLFATLDETTASDADYIKSPTRVAASADLIVRLYQSSTLIATWTHTAISETYIDTEQTLTAPQLAAITNFNNLFLEFDDNAGGIYRTSLGNPTTALTTPVKVSYRYRGLAETIATGTGALIAQSSIVVGAGSVTGGVATATGTGALIAQSSIVAGVGSATSASSGVTLNATGSKLFVTPAATTANYTGLNIAAGTDRLIVVSVVWDNTSTTASGLAITWDPGTANQPFTKIFSTNVTSISHPPVEYWGLVNPTGTGTKTIALSWTASNKAYVVGMAFNGVDPVVPIANINMQHIVTTLPIISLTGRKVMATGASNFGGTATGILGTPIYSDDGVASGAAVVAAWAAHISGASPSTTAGQTAGDRTLALIDIKATGDAAASATWDPANKTSAVSLNGGNLITLAATGSGIGTQVRTVQSHSTGKYYAEFTAVRGVTGGQTVGPGICTGAHGLGSYIPGWDTNGACYLDDGSIFIGNAFVSTGVSFVTGDIVCLAVDTDNKKMWIAKGASGLWNNSGTANPATNTGGNSFSSLAAGPYFAIMEIQVVGQVMTANFGGTPYLRTPPAGFGNW